MIKRIEFMHEFWDDKSKTIARYNALKKLNDFIDKNKKPISINDKYVEMPGIVESVSYIGYVLFYEEDKHD